MLERRIRAALVAWLMVVGLVVQVQGFFLPLRIYGHARASRTIFTGTILGLSRKRRGNIPLYDNDNNEEPLPPEATPPLTESINGSNSKSDTPKEAKPVPTSESTPTAETADTNKKLDNIIEHAAISQPAGPLWNQIVGDEDLSPKLETKRKKRVLILCTGGTLTMAKDPLLDNALAPVPGALTEYLKTMTELTNDPEMPEVYAHEYSPLIDSSDMGPGDWAVLASDIGTNYFHFDGFVVLTGTDTMAYAASALSFMLENLGKPVVFTGSQIPLLEPYNDARKNLIMALIFACRDTVHEVTIFFHDRLLRACRASKINTSRLLAFDSPNMEPLAHIGITIDENDNLLRPPPKWRFRVHTNMETRLITLRLVPGFDDAMMGHMIRAAQETHLKGLVLQLYGTGNLPSLKEDFVNILKDAVDAGVCVVACTQCFTGSVMMGHYVTGRALKRAGVVSANDMTVEATNCKLAYLLGRNDLSLDETRELMGVNLRGELTPPSQMPPPPLSSAYQQAIQKQQMVQQQKEQSSSRGVTPY